MFTVTKDHIKLLKHAYVGWDNCEFGAPSINPKRPYGNSDVIGDIVEILKIKNAYEDRDKSEFKQSVMDYCCQVHGETQIALQIMLSTGKLKKGTYISKDICHKDWELVKVVPTLDK